MLRCPGPFSSSYSWGRYVISSDLNWIYRVAWYQDIRFQQFSFECSAATYADIWHLQITSLTAVNSPEITFTCCTEAWIIHKVALKTQQIYIRTCKFEILCVNIRPLLAAVAGQLYIPVRAVSSSPAQLWPWRSRLNHSKKQVGNIRCHLPNICCFPLYCCLCCCPLCCCPLCCCLCSCPLCYCPLFCCPLRYCPMLLPVSIWV